MPNPEVSAAVAYLTNPANSVPAASFPSEKQAVHLPGLYTWWCDEGGLKELSDGLGVPVTQPLIYAGQAGAGTGADLKQRITSTHIGGRIIRSTFRLTLGAILYDRLNLALVTPEHLSAESEQRLTAWILQHLSIAVYPYADRETLRVFEGEVLGEIDAPLNLSKVGVNEVRASLKHLRRRMRHSEAADETLERPVGRPSLSQGLKDSTWR